MYSKSEIRKWIKEQKDLLTRDQMAAAGLSCAEQLFRLREFQEAESILIYIDTNREVPTRTIIEYAQKQGKLVAAPKVNGDQMNFYYFTQLESLMRGTYGILEPDSNAVAIPENALMIMPGVAFDKERNRVGYGGGYYDRYIAEHPYHFRIALAYDFQVMEHGLDSERYDQKPDIILTPSKCIRS